MSQYSTWKKFQFFDKNVVKEEGSSEPHPLFRNLNVRASSSGRGSLVYGDAEGCINIIDREFKAQSWQAYLHGVTHLKQLQRRNVVISIGNDEELDPTIKVWHLDADRRDKQGNPLKLQEFKLVLEHPVPVTCFAVTEQLSHGAVGFADGSIILMAGDIVRSRAPKQIALRRGRREAGDIVTGLTFHETRGGHVLLYCTTNVSVFYYSINEDGSELHYHDLHTDKGAELHCSTMTPLYENSFAVAHEDKVSFYNETTDVDHPPFRFLEGTKLWLLWFRSYLVVVSSSDNNDRVNHVNVYDLEHGFIALTTSIERVIDIAAEWGSIFLLTPGKLYQLEEKDTKTKYETLFQRHLYTLALQLAASSTMDPGAVVDISRKYGDHLYDKGNYDLAMEQYVKTIGRLEPSYVIRKFLHAQRIHNLTSYLQKLHEKNLAQPDHTTLLLNCYTKLKEKDQLERLTEFIEDDKLHFEVETAIKVCRQAQYHKHALFLARKHQEHDWFLKILLEDFRDFNNALLYIHTLDFAAAEMNMKKYGKVLVTNLPDATTELLKILCTRYQPLKMKPCHLSLENAHQIVIDTGTAASSSAAAASSSSSSAESATSRLADFLGGVLRPAEHQVEQLVLDVPIAASSSSSSSYPFASALTSSGPHYGQKAKAEEFIHIFVSQTEWLIRFLEFILSSDASASSMIYNTLLELYLRQGITDRSLSLLQSSKAEFNDDHTLILCQVYDFRDGLLLLYERMRLYREILQLHMQESRYKQVLATCTKHGDKDPNLWPMALSYFASQHGSDCNEYLLKVLQQIDRADLLPPLLVVEILAQNPDVTLSTIKDYITGRLQNENQLILEDQRRIRAYTEETERMREEIEKLSTTAKSFQNRKCSMCKQVLELPAVHFLCMHSFHQRCIENESECPNCESENSKILDIKRSLEDSADQHEQFYKQLEAAPDGFSIVAEYFGRCMFNKLT